MSLKDLWDELVQMAQWNKVVPASDKNERVKNGEEMAERVLALRDGNLALSIPGKQLAVFSIKEGKTGSIWVRCGQAVINKDGSLSVTLDVLPLDGKLHIREVKET